MPATTLPATTFVQPTFEITEPTVNYANQLSQCVNAEYSSAEAAAIPISQQALGRNPTPSDITQIATNICQQKLESEGVNP